MATLVLLGVAASRPVTRLRPAPLDYRLTVQVDYAGTPIPGSVYGTVTVRAGQPLLLGQLRSVGFAVRVALAAPRPQLHSSLGAALVLEDQGLTRTLASTPVQPWDSAATVLDVALPLTSYQTILTSLDDAFGPQNATLAVVTNISLHGTLAGRPLDRTLALSVPFSATNGSLVPASTSSADGSTATGAAASDQPPSTRLQATANGFLPGLRATPSTLLDLPVLVVRFAAAGFAALLVLALAALLRATRRLALAEPRAVPELLFGRLLVRSASAVLPTGAVVVPVSDRRDLAALAKRLELPLVASDLDEHRSVYWVLLDQTCYRWSCPDPPPPPSAPLLQTDRSKREQRT
ncbi:hypothetical protein [Aciditerrimonas ferrireducens]|uniref:hypothetical protein n=1 Tax=Aciditerrimonas ferrireducens TaxID=667306 RepID=UPI002002B1B9|nr:hypothetical protein [Aciditerrimonas ferrireducens]MCK4176291.1 hypothetical protein [Aciditerrimonas ferrireducens]